MQLLKQQNHQLSQGIYLRKKLIQSKNELLYIFEVEVKDFNNIEFQIDFKGSQNIKIRGFGDVSKIVKIVQPYKLLYTEVVRIVLEEGWKLKTSYKFEKRTVPIEKQLNYIKSDIATIQAEKTIINIIFKDTQISLISLEKLNSLLSQSMVKFVDIDFPPLDCSIFGNKHQNMVNNGTANHWRRPQSFLQSKQYYLFDRLHYKNLKIGKLDDRAFFSVVCILTLMHPNLIDKLFCNQKQINQNGLYRLCICKNGYWQTVIIDDYIPCETFSKPKFILSILNQIWIYLLQKAYAKLHGRYLALSELQINTVFHDLTGCPTLIINLQNNNAMEEIVNYFNLKYVVAFYNCEETQIENDQFNPLKHYAYLLFSIVSSKQQNNNITSFTIIDHNQKKIQLIPTNLFKKFKYVCICCIQNWQQIRRRSKFISIDLSTPQNKQQIVIAQQHYILQIESPSQLYICLHQEDLLIGNNSEYKKYYNVSIFLFQMNNSKCQLIQLKKYSKDKENQIKIKAQSGIYYILPIINQEIQRKKAPTEQDEILDIFKKLDYSISNTLKYKQLKSFFKVLGEQFSESDCNILLNTKDNSLFGYLHFKRLWYSNKKTWGERAINHYIKQNLFTFSIHSEHEIKMKIKCNNGLELNNLAHCEMISKYGKELYLNENNYKFIQFIYFENSNKIVEYMVENKCQRKITITVDFTESVNYNFMPAIGRYAFELSPQQKRFIMKLIPKQKCNFNQLERKENIFVKLS